MHRYDLEEFVSRMMDGSTYPDDIPAFNKLTPDGPWLCGGALRRLITKEKMDSDFDYFFKDEAQLEAFKKHIQETYGIIDEKNSDLNVSLKIKFNNKEVPVQLIKIGYYKNVEECLQSFDFTICQCGTDGKHLVVGDYTLWDLGRKRLALNELTYGASTVKRMIKYTKQGYTACQGVIVDILERIAADKNLIQATVEYVD